MHTSLSLARCLGLLLALTLMAVTGIGCESVIRGSREIPRIGLIFLDPVPNYVATIETTETWAQLARSYNTVTGAETNEIILQDTPGPALTFELRCVDGYLDRDALADGEPEEDFSFLDTDCANGIQFENEFPRRFRVDFETDSGTLAVPENGLVTLRENANGDGPQLAAFYVNTDVLR